VLISMFSLEFARAVISLIWGVDGAWGVGAAVDICWRRLLKASCYCRSRVIYCSCIARFSLYSSWSIFIILYSVVSSGLDGISYKGSGRAPLVFIVKN
jgi:hypothetical protein